MRQDTSRRFQALIAFVALPVVLAAILLKLYSRPPFGELDEIPSWAIVAAASAVVCWMGRACAAPILARIEAFVARQGSRAVLALCLAAFSAAWAVAVLVTQGLPLSQDEVAHLLQAQTFAEGRLWADAPSVPDVFGHQRFLVHGAMWVSQFPPGCGLLLAPFFALGAPPTLLNPLIGAATLVVAFGLARLFVGRELAFAGSALLGSAAFFLLNSASFFNHGLTALASLGFAFCGVLYLRDGRVRTALAAGALVGVVGLTRTQNALILAAPFLVALALAPRRRWGILWFGLGGLPFLAALLGYNFALTGHLAPIQGTLNSEPLGPSAESVRYTLGRLVRLQVWTSPLLLAGWAAAMALRLRRGATDFTDWIMPATLLAFLVYGGHGGGQYGPRYYYEAWPFALLTVLKAAEPLLQRSATDPLRSWAASGLVAALCLQLAFLPAALMRERDVVADRQQVQRAIQAAGLQKAIILLPPIVGSIRRLPPQDLIRNGLHIERRAVVYAFDRPEHIAALRAAFPGRPVYRYAEGRLVLVP